MDFKTMLQLPVIETSEVLKILQEVADNERKRENPNMPKISFSNTDGTISGYFINYDADKGVVLIGNWYDNEADLQYVSFHSISCIMLQNVKDYVHLLSDGKIPFTPDSKDVPTQLQLKKEIKIAVLALQESLGKELKIKFDAGENTTDTEKFYAKKAIAFIKETITTLAENNLAKEAFSESIDTINFNFSEENTVTLNERSFTISFNIEKGWKSIFSKMQLQNEIEKNL
ncbi:hypothetical protein [Zunongwangia sp. HRR-M8]|uniref:hypothetical protein n=1 Tax=Zunongwangia sp. HRR-M8 TaxID=3015170 RepID=UPI0022DE91EC|nr:hypothetical protein [Zunongwangia sp. HRR-M8]WBL21123.1 hypothetical protein PBT89_10300 [Zunongwangia sp. HRR-M8]